MKSNELESLEEHEHIPLLVKSKDSKEETDELGMGNRRS